LKTLFPHMKTVASEALQCPTILNNGFGAHRIEGIGDKHIPWVHNVRNTDAVAAIDDEDCMRILRLFNEPNGQKYLQNLGNDTEKLPLLGISSICNLLASIKTAKYFEMDENDVIFTVFTDSADMYKSRVQELEEAKGEYAVCQANADMNACLSHQGIDNFAELNYQDRKRVHNLKYYTWVEQQGKTYEEILEQWDPEYWRSIFEDEVGYFDQLIEEFNELIGVKS
ncbi:MAG TPA: pyridoxal-5-phosphate-dependent protein subunit beta, partial [Candidatus Cloacimonadota bacterium]|nr:pyridoxal-5-phosphate-dependent protein subunit beta [Candidatus Cloacimonadota bacterium]